MRFHHVGMVVRSVGVAEKLCRERLKDDAPLVWGPVRAFECVVAFSTRFPMIEFVVPEPESRLVKFLGGKSVLHHIAFAVEDVRRPAPSGGSWSIFSSPLKGSWSRWCRSRGERADRAPETNNSDQWFLTVPDAQRIIGVWRQDHNTLRPHSSLERHDP